MAPEVRPAKTLFVITTDGQENASTEFNLQRIRALIEKKKSAVTAGALCAAIAADFNMRR